MVGERSYTTALFDFGGTLFSYRPFRSRFAELLVELAREHGVDVGPDEAVRTYLAAARPVHRRYVELDSYLHRDLFGDLGEAFVAAFGLAPGGELRRRFYEAQTELALPLIRPRPEARSALQRLRGAGVHLGIVSNIDDDQFAALWDRVGLDDLFDTVSTSEEAGYCKPHRRFFDHALEKAGEPDPSRVVFVGDSPIHDVAGAAALGMSTVLLQEISDDLPPGVEPGVIVSRLDELLPLFGLRAEQ